MPSSTVKNVTIIPTPSGGSVCVGGFTRPRTWSNTVNWSAYKSSPSWDKPVNTYSDSKWVWSSPLVTATDTKPFDPNYVVHYYFGLGSEAAAIDWCNTQSGASLAKCASESRLRNEALISALNEAANNKFNAAVTLAEGRKTLDMIVTTANRVYRAYRSFRKGRFRDTAQALGLPPSVVHKTWLEYKYGWTPLLMDVKNAAEAYAAHRVGRPIVFTVRKRAKDRQSFNQAVANTYGWRGSGKAFYSATRESTRTVEVQITLEIVNSQLSTVASLGLTNPATVVWELIPFSFVFDWFISVGDYVNALSALDGLVVKQAVTSTIEYSTFTESSSDPTYTSGGIIHGAFSSTFVGSKRTYVRGPLSINLSDLYPPVNRQPLGWQKMVTGLALLRAKTSR